MQQPAPSGHTAGRPRVVIVDDEPLARDCIRLALAKADADIVAECGDGESGVKAIRDLAPDVVFLDVQMPELDGFGVIARVGAEVMPAVVFVTAYNAHALRAFEVHAIDYVLKPFDDARLLAAFNHARSAMLERRHSELGRRMAELVESWQHVATRDDDAEDDGDVRAAPAPAAAAPTSYITRFTIRDDGSARFIPAATVDWIEASRNYVVLHVGEETHRVRGSLSEVMTNLNPRAFARVHKSTIVNIDRIKELQPWFGGDYIAILRSGVQVKVSRRRVAQLLKPMS